jgi:UDP-N-acetylglucosamine--N-acetylmuramyl-(pentapeptide) pyrophosphoryl-undecaprenol N-acetylglucosamine transferase
VVAGGGTGGHVVPSLQIARALVGRGHAASTVELYGSRRGHEAATWPALEFPFTLLPGRGIRRSLRPAALMANVGAILGLAWACVRAIGSFLAQRPRAVVVVGGYASFPAGFAALVTRVPLVCVTTDAVPGAVVALLGRFAAANAVAFPDTDLPRSHVTGTPVAPEMAALDRSPDGLARARGALGLPADRWTIAAVSGSLGARRVNRAVAEVAQMWRACDALGLYHVTGRRDYEAFAAGAHGGAGAGARDGERDGERDSERGGGEGGNRPDGLVYRVVPYEDDMPDLYTAADVCITRAGAMTSAELLIAGVPAILVPLPGAPRDHQTRNAEALVHMGVAVLVPDPECDGTRLARELESLLSEPERLRAMREAARGYAHPDAAARVAELVDAHAR